VRWSLDPANKAAAAEMLARRLELAPDIAAAVYDVVTDKQEGFATDGWFDLEGFKNVLQLRAEYEGGTPAAPEKYLDLSYYQQALEGLTPWGGLRRNSRESGRTPCPPTMIVC